MSDLRSSPGPVPVVVEVSRGGMVESRHRGSVVVAAADGRVLCSCGDVELPVYGRSAIKPLQALAMVESGAADGYGHDRLALACASHGGERRHVSLVRHWLAELGLAPGHLECGAHLPSHEPSACALLRSGGSAGPEHNNCSGKHTGFLALARHMGCDVRGYVELDHPVQQIVLGILEEMTGLDLSDAARGRDGCGIPVLAMPLGNIALAMARLSDPADQPERRQRAARRVVAAMASEPWLVAGSGRGCTRIMTAARGRIVVKTGAEGVYCAAAPDHGIGIALKIEDGNGRAGGVLMVEVLHCLGLLDDATRSALDDVANPAVHNRRGEVTGHVRPAGDLPFHRLVD
ncbi:MAG: asparaginase [Alphaproteobacteria bacterium]|nr:asparaginase [Alphaproteobacteria bacterium]